MATVLDTLISVTTTGETFQTSNAGWTAVDSGLPSLGNLHARVSNSGGVNTVYGADGHTYAYRYTTAPTHKNQSVTARIRRRTATAGTYWQVSARISGSGTNLITASFSGDTNKPVTLAKTVGSTTTSLGSSNDGTRLSSDGAEADLTLEVTGDSPNIQARVLWNGVQVIAPVTIADAALDAIGQVGFSQRSFNADTQTAGYHVIRLTALDNVGGGGGGTSLLPKLLNLTH